MLDIATAVLNGLDWQDEREPCQLDDDGFGSYLARLRSLCPRPEVGFFGPESVAWQVNREAALYLGGLRALLMQVAHPAVAEGVLQHSRFVRDPFGRAWNTFVAVQTIIFGTADEAIQVAWEVFRRHRRVRGPMPPDCPAELGRSYDAADPELILWVHATLIESAAWTLEHFVAPLDDGFKHRLYVEGQVFALFFGLTPRRQPPDWRSFVAWFRRRLDWPWWFGTEGSRRVAAALLGDIWWARPLKPALRFWAACTLPPQIRDKLGLRTPAGYTHAFHAATRAIRSQLPALPGLLRYTPFYHRARRRLPAAGVAMASAPGATAAAAGAIRRTTAPRSRSMASGPISAEK